MSQQSAIEWTEATWNPVTGCSKVSPGCAHCYAETFAERWRGIPGHPYEQGFDLRLWPSRLEQPLRWRRPRMIFVNSMSDLFHEEIHDDYIARVFSVMALAQRHTFQVLTKRPERMKKLLGGAWIQNEVDSWVGWVSPAPWPLPNVWLGTSIENRRFVHRADLLRQTPAAVRFISAEPLLGPLVAGDGALRVEGGEPWGYNPVWPDGYVGRELDLIDIDWLICGGESGPKHRPIRPGWVRDLRDDAQAMRTAFFFKQWGGARPKSGGRLLDGREWNEMPERAQSQETA